MCGVQTPRSWCQGAAAGTAGGGVDTCGLSILVCCPYEVHHGLLLRGAAGVGSTFLLRQNDVKELFVWKFYPAFGCFNRSPAVSEQ